VRKAPRWTLALEMAAEELRAPGTPFSLSFSGSGFLVLYQVGVVQSLLELAPELLKSACKVYGSSAGSLIAAAVVCGISLGKEMVENGLGGMEQEGGNGFVLVGCWDVLPERFVSQISHKCAGDVTSGSRSGAILGGVP